MCEIALHLIKSLFSLDLWRKNIYLYAYTLFFSKTSCWFCSCSYQFVSSFPRSLTFISIRVYISCNVIWCEPITKENTKKLNEISLTIAVTGIGGVKGLLYYSGCNCAPLTLTLCALRISSILVEKQDT